MHFRTDDTPWQYISAVDLCFRQSTDNCSSRVPCIYWEESTTYRERHYNLTNWYNAILPKSKTHTDFCYKLDVTSVQGPHTVPVLGQAADRMIPLQQTTSWGTHDILAAAVKPSRTCPSDDAEEEDHRPTTSAGRRGIKGENPLILQTVMSAASHAQEEEEDHEDVDFVDDDDYMSVHSVDDESDVTVSHPSPSSVDQPPPKQTIPCPQHRSNQLPLPRIPTQTSLPHSPHVQDRYGGSPTRSSLHSVSMPFSPPFVGSTSPAVVQVSLVYHSPAHRLPPATPLGVGLSHPIHGRHLRRRPATGYGGQREQDFFQQQADMRQDIRGIWASLSAMSESLQEMVQFPQVVDRVSQALDRMDRTWQDMSRNMRDLISIQREESARHHALAMKMMEGKLKVIQSLPSRPTQGGEPSYLPAGQHIHTPVPPTAKHHSKVTQTHRHPEQAPPSPAQSPTTSVQSLPPPAQPPPTSVQSLPPPA
ncbi:uncharacterized protein LOC144791808 [Lissotriton helveticus]